MALAGRLIYGTYRLGRKKLPSTGSMHKLAVVILQLY
jgi:hypothetical protein